MNKKLVIYIILIILAIILLICVYELNYIKTHKGEGQEETDNVILNTMMEIEDTGEKDTVIWYAEQYIEICNNFDMEDEESNSIETLFDILDEEYIQENNIDETNISQFLTKYNRNNIDVEFLQFKNITATIKNYYLIGKAGNEDIKMIIKFDYEHETFSIIPCNDMDRDKFLNKTSSQPIEEFTSNIFEFKF